MDRFGPSTDEVLEYIQKVDGMPPERVQDVIAAVKNPYAVDFDMRYYLKAWPVVVATISEAGLMQANDALSVALSITRPAMALPTGSDRETFLTAAMTAGRAVAVRDRISEDVFGGAVSPMRFAGIRFTEHS